MNVLEGEDFDLLRRKAKNMYGPKIYRFLQEEIKNMLWR